MTEFKEWWGSLGDYRYTLMFTACSALMFAAGIGYLCNCLALTANGPYINALVCILGALSGWAVGMFFSPFDQVDLDRFRYVGKSVAAFISGYVLSKIDTPLNNFLKNVEARWDGDLSVRFALFASSFLLAALVVFITRAYAPAKVDPKKKAEADAAAAAPAAAPVAAAVPRPAEPLAH